ncbi:MAG: HAD family hydrolase [Bacillus sp. (in: firmicutes)]
MRDYAIFDLDGTLLDSMHVWETVADDYCRKNGLVPPADYKERLKTMSLQESAEYLIDVFALSATPREVVDEIISLVERQYTDLVQLKPGIESFLTKLDARKCIATAMDRKPAEAALRRLGVLDHFDFILTCQEIGSGKDKPGIFLAACNRWETPPAEVAVYEDSLHAIQTAKQAGFYTIAIYDHTSHSEKEEIKRISDCYFEDWTEASSFLTS